MGQRHTRTMHMPHEEGIHTRSIEHGLKGLALGLAITWGEGGGEGLGGEPKCCLGVASKRAGRNTHTHTHTHTHLDALCLYCTKGREC